MKQKRVGHRFMAFVLVITLILSMSIVPSSATDTTEGISDKRGEMGIVFLGTGDTPKVINTKAELEEARNAAVDTSAWEPGVTKFWVGLYISDLDEVDKGTAEDINSNYTSHFTGPVTDEATGSTATYAGIYCMFSGITYDSTYIKPVVTGNNPAQQASNYRNSIKNALGLFSDYSGRTITVDSSTVPEQVIAPGLTGREELLTGSSMRETYAKISYESPLLMNEESWELETLDDHPVFMQIVQFQYVEKPDDGAKVMEASLDTNKPIIQTGLNDKATVWLSQWDKNRENTKSSNLKNHFDYVGAPNLFPTKHTITYNLNGGSFGEEGSTVITSAGITENTSVGAVNLPTKSSINAPTGKFFDKWILDDDGNGSYDPNEDTTEVDENYVVTKDILVFATYKDGYKLTFDTAGGAFADGTTQQAFQLAVGSKPGSDNVPTADPERADYQFVGWNTAGNGTGTSYDSSSIPETVFSESTTLYAQWEAQGATKATVTFDENVAAESVNEVTSSVSPSSITVNVGDPVLYLPNEPVRDNYTFKEWNTEKNGVGTAFAADSAVPKDITVYAQWEADAAIDNPKNVTVTFIDDGDTPANPKSVVIKANDVIGNAMPTNPKKTGSAFDKWIVDENGSGDIGTDETKVLTAGSIVTADTQVVAAWKNKITISFDANGGTFVNADLAKPVEVDVDEVVEFPGVNTGKTDYELWGWSEKPNGSGTLYTTSMQAVKTTTMYAIWNASPTPDDPNQPVPEENVAAGSVLIRFNENGGTTAASPKERIVKLGDALGLLPDEPKKDNYQFTGWNTEPNGMGNSFDGDTPVSVTLGAVEKTNTNETYYVLDVYAQWSGTDENKVTVNFYVTKGAITPFISKVINPGDTLGTYMPYAPTRAGFTFKEFLMDTGGSYDVFTSSTAVQVPSGNELNVYGTWTTALNFEFKNTTVEYDGQPKGVSVKAITVTENGISTNVTERYNFDDNFEIVYSTPNAVISPGDAGVTPIDAGTYDIHVFRKVIAAGIDDEISVGNIVPDQLTINPKGVMFRLTSDQVQKTDGSVARALTAEPVNEADKTELKDKYAMKYTPVVVSGDAITAITTSAFSTVSPSAVGDYTAYIDITDSNYAVGSVTGAAVYTSDLEELKDKILLQFTLEHNVRLSDIRVVTSGAIDYSTGNAIKIYDSPDMNNEATISPDGGGEFYIRVPADASGSGIKIGFIGTLPDNSIEVSGGALTVGGIGNVGADGAVQQIKDIILEPAENGSYNDFTFTIDGKEYTFHIQQLVTPRIQLAYGNSPYGEIMKDNSLSDEEKASAKAEFDSTSVFDGVTRGAKYYAVAWDSYSTFDNGNPYNGDKDETAIFVYQRSAFRDPGFTAYYSDGTEVDPQNVTITLEAISFNGGFPRYTDSDGPQPITVSTVGAVGGNLFDDLIDYDIRPDVYAIHYSFIDRVSLETTEVSRKMISISKLGDVRIDAGNTISGNDASSIVANVFYLSTSEANTLFKFKIADALPDEGVTISGNDASRIVANVNSPEKLTKYYKELPNN